MHRISRTDRQAKVMRSGIASKRDFARRMFTSSLALLLLAVLALPGINATEIETYAFEKVWWRTDLPVANGHVNRTWVWGPEPISSLLLEPYDQGQASGIEGTRWVQYFDKTRVEITRADGARDGDWHVTNGLLARELITGRMQLGDEHYVWNDPADINVAGDHDDLTAPTYRSLNVVLEATPLPHGSTVTQTIDRHGNVGHNDAHAGYGVETLQAVEQTNRTIASVFWNFMNAEGTIYDGFDFVHGRLFQQPFFATGLPITEPYWTTVRVGGEPRDVLIQAFERRVLTYTPGNPSGWQVEAANVGRHYYRWRYMDGEQQALRSSEITSTRDLSGNLIFMGEVANNSRATYAEVEVTMNIYDHAGGHIAEFRTYLDSALIEPGERLPFQIWTEYTGEFANYDISIRSRPSYRFYRADVVVEHEEGIWASATRFDVRGTVRNSGTSSGDYMQFVVALYDDAGRVVGYRWGMLDPVVLDPGEHAIFETTFFDPPRFSHHAVFILD
jgi:hypothetical protein